MAGSGARVDGGSRPVTVRVEQRDIYQTVRLEGTVEAYEPVTVGAPAAGHFTPVSPRINGRTVRKGARLGVVRTCRDTGTPVAAPSDGSGESPSPTPSATPRCGSGGTAVRASVSGVVAGVQDQDVKLDAAVATIQPTGFHARLPVSDAALLYRFTTAPRSGRGEIVGGPSGFTVGYERQVYDRDTGRVSVYVSLPTGIRLFAGLHAVVVFVTSVKDRVPALPRSAVRGQSGKGEVVAVDAAGGTKRVAVTIGTSDDEYVEVHDLAATVDVLRYPLESDFND